MTEILTQHIPARPSPGLTRAASPTAHQGGDGKCTTGAPQPTPPFKLKGRSDIIIGTWNVRTLHATGKVKELTHEMERYQWNVIGLCEVRWKNFGELSTEEGHKIYFSGREDRHEHGVGFLIHKNITNCVMGCRPVSSRIITIRLRATPFNITIIQIYAPTSGHDDREVEDFYDQLQDIVDQTPGKDIVVVQGDWNAKIGEDACTNWADTCGHSCNDLTNDRGLRLLEFARYNNLLLANTLGQHKKSRRWTWQSPNGEHRNQIDYILVRKRFKSCIKTAKTRSFPGADIGSDHNLVLMAFHLHLKKIAKQGSSRLRFDLDKLKDPEIAEVFRATIGGKFAPLTTLYESETDIDLVTDAFNTTIIETAKEILGRKRAIKKPWVSANILELCDERRKLKSVKSTTEGAPKYRAINKKIRKDMKKAKEEWIEQQCSDIDENLQMNNSKKAYKIVKDLTSTKQSRVSTIQDKSAKCITEEHEILKRWTEYCSELYNEDSKGDLSVLNCPMSTNTDKHSILREEVELAVQKLKKGKSAGADNIPGELIQAGGDPVINILTNMCNTIWQTGEWPTPWTQSLVITLPKKGNLQLCQNYRTISLISHPSKVMLMIILNRLKPQAEQIIAEEQAGFRAGRSTTEQIFNLRVLCEKHLQHQSDLYHVFIDFKKAFDRVWHAALWATMHKFNINANLIEVIKNLYNRATSAVLFNSKLGDWFKTTVGVRQGCLLSPILFNLFLERIMTDVLEDHVGTVSIGGRIITNLRFADDIDGLAGSEDELKELTAKLEKTAEAYGMEINAEKTKVMANRTFSSEIRINGQKLEEVSSFKYLGAIISDEGSKPEILARMAQTTAALSKLKNIWQSKKLSLKSKIRLMRSLTMSVFLYGCEAWTLTADLQRRISALEMRCFRRILNISYTEHTTNEAVHNKITAVIGPYEDLLTSIKKKKLRWYGHVARSGGLAKTIMQGTVQGGRKRGRQKKRWEDDIKEWTGLSFTDSQRAAQDRDKWREIVFSPRWCPNDPPTG